MHSTLSKLPVSNDRQVRPASMVTSDPLGPTASATVGRLGTQADPDRYPEGRAVAGRHVRPPSLLQAALPSELVGLEKSPPTAMPLCRSRNCTEKTPADGPPMSGTVVAVQVCPRSWLTKMRGGSIPPEAR